MEKLAFKEMESILWRYKADSLTTQFNHDPMTEPARRPSGIPDNQAIILSPEESNPKPGGATLRGTCDKDYVLQIRRISSHTGPIALRVFTKDADDEGNSAVINAMNLNAISNSIWVTVLLYDEDNNEICFDEDDDLAFIQPFDFDEDIEFEVRLNNVSGTTNTTPETILWDAMDKFYYTMYLVSSGDCINQNPDHCCAYYLEAQSVASSVGDMQFVFVCDAGGGVFTLSVPPTDSDSHNSTNC
ncbi:MAG: hypothetical protein K9I85_15640 [Saprospiraceae bacterium]|nr:hypothetical protein [Saprospiraceae bacterium]